MRKIAIAAAGLCLAGCSSMPSFDFLRPTPPSVTVQIDSLPPGAEARTSNGGSCKTPCSVSVPAENFTVTYTLNKYQSETVPVQVVFQPDATALADPNPVAVELKPLGPPPKGKKKPKIAQAKTSRAAAPSEASPFPPPPGAR